MKNCTLVVLFLSALAWSGRVSAFECSLSADGGAATAVKPNGEILRLGIERQRECQGIRVSSGTVRIVYAGREGVQESILPVGAVINPEDLKPATNGAFAKALKQLGLILAGDYRQRAGMMRSTGLRAEDYADILPHGPVLWDASDMVIPLPRQAGTAQVDLQLSAPGGRTVPVQRTEQGYLVRRADLAEGQTYGWKATVNDKTLQGSFVLSTTEQAARLVQEITQSAERSAAIVSTWSRVLNQATGLAEKGYIWDAGVRIRAAL